MTSRDPDRIDAIVRGVLEPLVNGGDLYPVLPIGTRAAPRLADHARALEADSGILARRLERARELWPVDSLGPLSTGEWLLVFALNDLIQASNPSLSGVFGQQRPRRLLSMVDATIERAGSALTLAQAVARHSTFARVLELARSDTRVSWWTGSQVFRGRKPPARLLAWPSLRRVTTEVELVILPRLAEGRHMVEGAYRASTARFLASTPLTDLSCLARRDPPFAWTGATLGLLRTVRGRTLAERAVRSRGDLTEAAQCAARATEQLAPAADGDPVATAARRSAEQFSRMIAACAADRAYGQSATGPASRL